jgi:alginate O-acetyltransferase complex protein AlgI
MLFNSIDFLLFFPLVVILYFSLPHKYRWILLLAASYYFYMCWKVEYVILIMISTLVDYLAGLKMAKLDSRAKRKKYLVLSLVANLGMLIGFKYFNFFSHSVQDVFSWFNIFYHAPELKVLLPVGISFYTFQTLSYTIDVYKGVTPVEKHLGRFASMFLFSPN